MRCTHEPSTTNSGDLLRVRPGVRGWLATGLVLTGGMVGAPPASSEPPTCGEAAARKVQRHYEGVRDLTARFTQVSQVVSLGAASVGPETSAKGEVSFARPGRMRWSYEEPEPSLVVTDGDELWIYDPAEKEAQHLRTAQGFLSGAALQFLLGRGEMSRDFEVRAIACGEEEIRLRLVPREAAAYEQLEIRVDPASGEVRETVVTDLVGNVTRVSFQDVRTNTGVESDAFRFAPPAGVRIVEVPPPGS